MRVGVLVTVGLLGCGSAERVEVEGIVRHGQTGQAMANARVEGEGVQTEADEEGRFTLRLPVGSDRTVRARAPGLCPGEVTVDVAKASNPELTVHVHPRLELQTEYLQVGFDTTVEIEARTRCDAQAPLRWSQTSGPELGRARMRTADGGRRLTIQTHAIDELADLPGRIGMVPLSRAQRGDYRFELRARLGNEDYERTVRVTAASPQTGVFQVPTGEDAYLDGGERGEHEWTLVDRPEDSSAELVDSTSRTPHFRPDLFGQYLIRYEPTSLEILVQAGPHDEVPRDCGREGCHRPEDEGWATTAHSRTFRRGLNGQLGALFERRCWSCHGTGVEEGIHNGGLHRVADQIGWTQPEPHEGAWDEAPRQMRRFGAVWCSACHGPGRILPPPFHWEYEAKFSAGVCARCHDVVDDPDSIHESWQFRQWRRAPMASFVGDSSAPGPAARRECASCHSAQGFLAWQDRGQRTAPEAHLAVAITCTTCHDPHDGSNPRGLRVVDAVEPVAGRRVEGLGTGAICVTCHRSGIAGEGDDSMAPHAPQADVILGRGSQLVRLGRPGVHAELANSCVSCHMADVPATSPLHARAGGHTFSVRDLEASGSRVILSAETCSECHGTEVPPQAIGGIEDWDGDGRADNVGEEFDRALSAIRAPLAERIAGARVRDECPTPRLARGYRELDARLVLVDGQGRFLGDCDGDGELSGRERPIGVEQMSRDLRKVVWDVAMLERDGSHGRHNPAFSFAILRAVQRQLAQ